MKIDNIIYHMRGWDGAYQLGPMVAITGPNKSGKTAVLDTISLCMGGHIPRLGKRNDKLEPIICPDGTARAEIITSTGETKTFTLSRKDGSISKFCNIGKDSNVVLIDSQVFLRGSQQDRIEMIQSAMGLTGNLIEQVKSKLPKTLKKELVSKKTDFGEWLTETVEKIKGEAKTEKAVKERLAKAAASIESFSEVAAIYDPSQKAKLDSEIQGLNRRIAELGAEKRSRSAVVDASPTSSERPGIPRDQAEADLENARAEKSIMEGQMQQAHTALSGKSKHKAHADGVCHECGAKFEHWSATKKKEFKRGDEPEKIILSMDQLIKSAPTDSDLEEVEGRIAELEGVIKGWEEYDDHMRKVERAEQAAAELVQIEEEIASKNEVLTTKQEERDALAQLEGAHIAAQRQKQMVLAMEQERNEAEEAFNAIKEALEIIKREVGVMSERIMGPVLAVAAKFTKGITAQPLECVDFKIGYTTNGQWLPLEGFSGSEAAVTAVAIQAALMCQGDIKTIMVDEAQRIDHEMLSVLMKNIEDAIEDGTIEQAILVGSRIMDGFKKGDKLLKKWQVITTK